MKAFRHYFSILLTLAAVFAAQGQNQLGTAWTRVKDDKIEILVPPNYLVDTNIEKSFILAPVRNSLPQLIDLFEKPRITGDLKSVRIIFSAYQLRQVGAAKNYLWFFVGRDNPKHKHQDIQSGDFTGRITFYDSDKYLSTRIAVAVKTRIYLIDAHAKMEDRQIYERILASLKLGGQELFKFQTDQLPSATKTVLISELQTSPEILQVLGQKQDKSEIKVVKADLNSFAEEKDERDFSRPGIILRQPPTFFGPGSDPSGKTGTIKLKINLLAGGRIGSITSYSDLPEEIVSQAVKAARKIKFLPAEIDGKKVDSVYTVEYVFDER